MCKCDENNFDFARLEDRLNDIESAMAPLLNGHPILFLQEASDIASFDAISHLGSGIWAGWAMATGESFTYNGSTISTFDMRDRVPVGAGTTYSTGDYFGEAQHTLIEGELPLLTITPNDPGHTHSPNDPGHVHAVDEDPHTHAAASDPHTHSITLTGGGHIHPIRIRYRVITDDAGGTEFNALEADQTEDTDNTEYTGAPANTDSGTHEHDGASDATTVTVTVTPASTGIGIVSAFTGMTFNSAMTGITIPNIGGGGAHNNLQPSCAGLWVQKIG